MQAARGASLTSGSSNRLPLILGIAGVAWLVDQGTKLLAVRDLDGHAPVQLVGDLLRLTFTRNPGAAFSAGASWTLVISLFAIVALVVVLWLGLRVTTVGWSWAFGLLTAGIAGNLTDRIFRSPAPLRGHVVDFLQLPHWPIFNVADVCINVGALLIIIQAFRGVQLGGGPQAEDPQEESPEENQA